MPYLWSMGNSGKEKPCEVCGTSFSIRSEGKPQKYCSGKCRNVSKSRKFRADNPEYGDKYRKPKIVFKDKACKHCNSQFTPIRNNHVYCSESCNVLALLEKNKVLATCRECGARFTQEVKNQRYCTKCKEKQRLDRSSNNEVKARLYR